MNQQQVNYTYQPYNPGFQEMVVPSSQMPGMPMDKSAYEKFQGTIENYMQKRYYRFWFTVSFFVHLVITLLLSFFVGYGMVRNKGAFPILRTSFTSKYGDLPDTIHPTLYGFTTILADRDTGFKPVPTVPVSFHDLPATDSTRKDSYYHCVDGTLNYTKLIGPSTAEVTRAKGICMVERFSAVATYENHESSMTFSSAWSPVLMITIVLWISTSWQLLLVDFKGIGWMKKKYIYASWHIATFFFIMLVSYVRTNDQMVPRNNIMFAAAILIFSVIQQMYIMNRYGTVYRISPTETHNKDDINFVKKLYKNLEKTESTEEKTFDEKRLAFIVLLSDWFLLPILAISMFALFSNNTLEWVFQATYVRYQLIIFGFVLITQLKVVEQATGEKYSLIKKDSAQKMQANYEFHPRLVILFAVIFALINEIISMQDTWAAHNDHTAVKDFAMTYVIAMAIYFIFNLLFCIKIHGADSDHTGLYINVISSGIRVTFFVLVLVYLFNDYNRFSCWLSSKSNSLFCGHADPLKNLNNREFLRPMAVTSTNATAVFEQVLAGLTYTPVL